MVIVVGISSSSMYSPSSNTAAAVLLSSVLGMFGNSNSEVVIMPTDSQPSVMLVEFKLLKSNWQTD